MNSPSLYSNQKVRNTFSLDFEELYDWAHEYHTRGPYPVPAYKRFWILEYQIPQALAYKGKNESNYAEGLAALIVNAFIFSAALKLPLYQHLKYKTVTEVPKSCFDAMRVLKLLGNCWQMISYQQAGSARHRSRYKEDKLTKLVAELIEVFCSYLPEKYEELSINDTTKILTGDL